jgi:8-hydroxy-5-deazaflavin:NADPH oxidoreductase
LHLCTVNNYKTKLKNTKMNITILGTGSVGQTFATKFIELGHDVLMGTRNASETSQREKFAEWHTNNNKVQLATLADAVAHGEIIINALQGASTITALKSVEEASFDGKIIVDVSNPLDFSKGFPPTLLEGLNNTTSLGEEIQKILPNSKVVKTLNTMWGGLMVNPAMIGNGDHNAFVSGNDADAKQKVKEILTSFGWMASNILDLGDITTARGVEMWLPIWLRIYGATNNGAFNIKIVS